jgi:iron complex transport system substrate-binding protein
MREKLYRLIQPFLLMAFSFILITACHKLVVQKNHISLKPSVECRVIQHEFGKTCVSLKPQRIIALNPQTTLDPLIALGIKPVGFASYNGNGKKEVLLGVSFDEVKGAKNVGDASQPSLEKILMLKPDLILSTDYSNAHQKYKLLSAIAPTISVAPPDRIAVIDLENKAYFKENLRYIAKLFGQEAKAEEVLNQYQKRIEELKKSLGKQLQQIEVSVIFYGEGYIWTIAKSDTISHILTDIGLRHKFVPYGKWNLSIETIGEYDSNILFIIDVDGRGSSFYFQHPIFSSLKVVKNNRAYVVSQENWRTVGMSGVNKILDDLFKYLLKRT